MKTASTCLRRGDVVVASFVPHSISKASSARSTALAFVPLASGVSDAVRTSVVVVPPTAATTTASLARSAWAICDGAVTTPQFGSGVSQLALSWLRDKGLWVGIAAVRAGAAADNLPVAKL